jgi:hypothetical protein
MGMMIPDFELEYRKSEIQRYQEMLDDGKTDHASRTTAATEATTTGTSSSTYDVRR